MTECLMKCDWTTNIFLLGCVQDARNLAQDAHNLAQDECNLAQDARTKVSFA